jgi:hypothetical protein
VINELPLQHVCAEIFCANSLVGGVVADVFQADTRGVPMNVFSFLILSGQGLGAVIFGKHRYECVEVGTYCGDTGWVEMRLGFRWIAWSAYSFYWT